ncbi:hypothetical protein NP534_20550 [Pseudomonas sp. 39004]|jgi:hypothetical protein|nr:hypothetical protein [Pseudomonas sp. 39004]MDD1962504.1 hypothetical protein [Pseudomonas sp. 39004]
MRDYRDLSVQNELAGIIRVFRLEVLFAWRIAGLAHFTGLLA